MGVLRFFKWVMKRYKNRAIQSILQKGNEYVPQYGKYYSPDVLLIDCNAIFHPACQSVFNPDRKSLLVRKEMTYEEKKKRAFEEVCKTIERLIRVAQPRKAVYLAIDGVAGLCKQSQQRKRRFKSAQERLASGDPSSWDSSVLTVGTPFMKELGEYIRQYFSHTSILSSYRKHPLRILLNDMNVPGEGEHKLVRFVENDPHYKSYCIYSPDADLIMLGMISPKSNVTVLRENIYTEYHAAYFVVSMKLLREAFLADIQRLAVLNMIQPSPEVQDQWTEQHLIEDVVLFLFVLGNDFLPHMSCLDIIQDGIETLLNAYSRAIYRHGYLRHTRGQQKDQFNIQALHSLFSILKDMEPQLLYQKFKKQTPEVPDSVLVSSIQEDSVDMQKYREAYYKRNFGLEGELLEDSIESICDEYCRGLMFVILYYTKMIPSFDWYYPYHYAPLCCDLSRFIESRLEKGMEYRFLYKPPLSQVEALASVLHPSNFNLLPSDVADCMNKRALIDSDFPTEFETDLEGKLQSYEGVILLPTIPYHKIKALLKKFALVDPPCQVVDLAPNSRHRY
jgi:5'-3' exoribonuclease 2